MWRTRLILILLFVSCFSLAAWLEPRHTEKLNANEPSDSVLASLLGDGRKMVADYFAVQADVYFHSGYYPSIFDEARAQEEQESDISHPEKDDHDHDHDHAGHAHEEEKGFLGEPRDWIDAFSRHFRPTRHTHLHGETVAEMLPWLKLSAELDPHRIQSFLVTAYWLRSGLGKTAEAEDFLRAGLRSNTNSPDLSYALGEIYLQDHKDYAKAKNLFVAALRFWHDRDDSKPEIAKDGGDARDYLLLESILGGLAQVEMATGHLDEALKYLKILKANAADPEGVQKRIDELQAKMNAGAGQTNQPSAH